MTTTESVPDVGAVLSDFGGDPQRAEGLAAFLGFESVADPVDRLGGRQQSNLKNYFHNSSGDRFGVHQLYRVGERGVRPGSVGLWIAVLNDWGNRSSDRDRARRRVARAMVQQTADRRALVLMVPPAEDRRIEAELIFPRTRVGASAGGSVTSIRAHLDLNEPTRFHRDLLRELRIPIGASLLDVSHRWEQQFSVERVTTKFYQEYAAVRNRIADALVLSNPYHPVVGGLSEDEARAWATRQMGRVLFLWFLQAKRWLGEPGGLGSRTYLPDLWERRTATPEREYYRGLLVPLFFDAMATGSSSSGQNPLLGYIPYLNGGLFRRNALEDRINDAGDVSLPDAVFDPSREGTLLGLLSRYRFTTRESTPEDQSVDPDPELLGRVFENLYQGDERHDTGTYYTPREIVHFMCREALDGYLRDYTGVEQKTLDSLRQNAVGSRDESDPTIAGNFAALTDALEVVRVCDPAVGSGAFLLGTIQEIVLIRRGILFSERDYIEPDELYETVSRWKQRTIQNCLFGVDINPEAVEICRLRLWLSMVLDMLEPPEPESNWALPNLDFRIVAGDSLIDRVPGLTFMESWPPDVGVTMELEVRVRVQAIERRIGQRKAEFDQTHRDPARLRELRDLIARDQREIIRIQLDHGLQRARAELRALELAKRPTKRTLRTAREHVDQIGALLADIEEHDFALVQKPFLWPVAFPEVLQANNPASGFDIVLANPPYVRMERIDNVDEKAYTMAFPAVAASRADLLVYFYARALQVLRPYGWLAFITSNKYMRAAYGRGTREFLTEKLQLHRVLDFGDLPLFEANGKAISAYPAVLIGRRDDDVEDHDLSVSDLTYPVRQEIAESGRKVNQEQVRNSLEDLDELLEQSEFRQFPQVLLRKDGWVLEDPALIRLFNRLMNMGTTLGEYVDGRIYRGIVTGLNDAFVIDQEKHDDLIAEDPQSAEILKPWLRGRDIKRWKADWAGLYVIFTNRGVDIDRYPAIREHLSWFRPDLEKRATSHLHPWYELQQPQEGIYKEFERPKIIWPDITRFTCFAFSREPEYLDATAFGVQISEEWLLPILNSTVFEFLIRHLTSTIRGGFVRPKSQYVNRLPLMVPTGEIRRRFETYASLGASGNAVEPAEFDDCIYELYGIANDEAILLSRWLSRHHPQNRPT